MKTTKSTLTIMKALYTSLILASILLATSCNVTKRSMHEIKENNYYHDSTIVQEKLTVQPVFIPADTTYASVLLKDLLSKGRIQSTDRHYTTTIEYRDSTIFMETTSDSVLLLLNQYEKTLKRFTTEINQRTDTTQTEKKTNFSMLSLGMFLFLVLLIVVLLLIISKRKSKPNV